jgi:hypothetical protein
VADDALGGAAEEHVDKPAAAKRGHDDEVEIAALRHSDDLVVRGALAEQRVESAGRLIHFEVQLFEPEFDALAELPLVGIHIDFEPHHRPERLDDVKGGEPCAKGPRQPERVTEPIERRGREIDRHQNLLRPGRAVILPAHDEHRTRCIANHPLGRAAEQHIGESGVTVRGDDDEIGAEFAGSLANVLRWPAGAHYHFVKKSRLA